MRPIQTYHCQGALFSNGKVALATQDIRQTYFLSLSQMCEYLEQFGYFKVEWEQEA